jgi:hypothetical protein
MKVFSAARAVAVAARNHRAPAAHKAAAGPLAVAQQVAVLPVAVLRAVAQQVAVLPPVAVLRAAVGCLMLVAVPLAVVRAAIRLRAVAPAVAAAVE